MQEREINIDQLWASVLCKYEVWREAETLCFLDTLTSVGVFWEEKQLRK